jgi:hypothetical protein
MSSNPWEGDPDLSKGVRAINSSYLLYSKDSKPYDIPYSEWIGRWYQWNVSIPKGNHPREAYSHEKCAQNQNDKNVWFLPDGRNHEDGSPERRECTVPHGKALLVQIYGSGCSYGEGLKTEDELKDCVNIGLDTVKFTAKIDGVEVMNSEKNRDEYLPAPYKCKLTYVQDNLYDVPAGTYDAMVAGYFLFVKPLRVGHHTIEFKETFSTQRYRGPSSIITKMVTDRNSNVVYDLTVQ